MKRYAHPPTIFFKSDEGGFCYSELGAVPSDSCFVPCDIGPQLSGACGDILRSPGVHRSLRLPVVGNEASEPLIRANSIRIF